MADEEKKPKSAPQWLLFVFPTILAIIGAYFALTRPEKPAPPVKAAATSTAPQAQ
jgi:hypothetical protein